VGYLGNVAVGADVGLPELRALYHAVVLACGAESDRRMGMPGEDAAGVFAAREFVWWYNGHPDARDLPVSLADVESVAVCGIGNVALDCARVLLKRPAALASTDIAAHALDALRRAGRVREVHLFARRGPVQVRVVVGRVGQGRPCAGCSHAQLSSKRSKLAGSRPWQLSAPPCSRITATPWQCKKPVCLPPLPHRRRRARPRSFVSW
jgi:hypothetical protein